MAKKPIHLGWKIGAGFLLLVLGILGPILYYFWVRHRLEDWCNSINLPSWFSKFNLPQPRNSSPDPSPRPSPGPSPTPSPRPTPKPAPQPKPTLLAPKFYPPAPELAERGYQPVVNGAIVKSWYDNSCYIIQHSGELDTLENQTFSVRFADAFFGMEKEGERAAVNRAVSDLKRRVSSLSSSDPLKDKLRDFVSATNLACMNQKNYLDFRKQLRINGWLPRTN